MSRIAISVSVRFDECVDVGGSVSSSFVVVVRMMVLVSVVKECVRFITDSTAKTMRKSLINIHVCLNVTVSSDAVASRLTLIDPQTPKTRLMRRHIPKYQAILHGRGENAINNKEGGVYAVRMVSASCVSVVSPPRPSE